MSRLIIDGNSVFEIDEECVKKEKIPKDCDIDKYLEQNSFMNQVSDKEEIVSK